MSKTKRITHTNILLFKRNDSFYPQPTSIFYLQAHLLSTFSIPCLSLKAIVLSFSQRLFLTKEHKKGASLIGDTPFIIEKSMILHFYRDPSRKFSL